jgi:3-hydroxyisobutyrate dehydrogenase-like beta-hydroxyacid dehydrogenase
MTQLGFVGLGAMGSRLARRLLDAGHVVAGYNRSPDKARALESHGLKIMGTPRAAAEGAEAVFSMVTDDAALRTVALGDAGLLAGLGRGAVWAEISTVSPAVTRELGTLAAARGAAMLDTPVSGSTITVEQGAASIAVGGETPALERVRPYLLAMAPGGITHVGPLGLAKTMKIATNLGLAVQMLAFSEAVLLAEKAGIARATAVEALLKSVIASPMVKYRGPYVTGAMPREAWFNVAMIQKDMQLALDQGHATGVPLPTTALVQQWLSAARAGGLGARDFGTLFDVLAGLSGLPPSPNT